MKVYRVTNDPKTPSSWITREEFSGAGQEIFFCCEHLEGAEQWRNLLKLPAEMPVWEIEVSRVYANTGEWDDRYQFSTNWYPVTGSLSYPVGEAWRVLRQAVYVQEDVISCTLVE